MKLQATYFYQGRYHLLFRWADGNLRDFWEKYPEPDDIPRTPGFAKWLVQQLVGLASGLNAILLCPPNTADDVEEDKYASENIRGVHGNLKPENILWFEQIPEPIGPDERLLQRYGRLLISDFGRVQIDLPETHFASFTYQSPEFDIQEELTQSFDIWTLGCVMLEFMVWYLGGFRARDEFSRNRAVEDKSGPIKLDSYFHKKRKAGRDGQTFTTAVLKMSVVKQFETLRNDPRTTQCLIDLLSLTEEKLLREFPEKRATCDEIVHDLNVIHAQCLRSEEYCSKPVHGSQ